MTDLLATSTEGVQVTKQSLDDAADVLRALVALTYSQPDDRLHTVLELTVQGHGPATILQETGMTRAELADTIRVIGQRFHTRRDKAPDGHGTALFPLEPDPSALDGLKGKQRETAMEEIAVLRAENPLPFAWQAEYPEAGVRKAVAAIRTKTEVDENLQSLALRVAASQSPPPSGLLTFAALRATWVMIQLGQFPRLAADPDLPVQAAQSAVVAYDALESARADSVAAMSELRNDPDPEKLDVLTVRARPLAEAAVRRLERIIAVTRDSGSKAKYQDRGMQIFLNETADLKVPRHVGELNEGQIHRIGLMLGLHTDPIADRLIADFEARLTDLGLEADIPWLKGVWISAFSCQREPDFWKAVDRLIEGDTDWAQPLQ